MSYSIKYKPPAHNYGNLTVSAPAGQTGYTYTSTGTSATDLIWGNNGSSWAAAPVTISQKATIELKGDDADVVINGESLKDTLKAIQETLRMPVNLKRDPALEKDWAELQAAADHYEKLKKEYLEKQRVWNTLKDTDN